MVKTDCSKSRERERSYEKNRFFVQLMLCGGVENSLIILTVGRLEEQNDCKQDQTFEERKHTLFPERNIHWTHHECKKAFSKLEVIQHIRDKNPYPEFTLFIDYRQLLSLQELYYCLCKEKDSRASQVRRQILKCPIRRLWPQMSPSARRRILIHRFAGALYDLYFMYLKK